MLRFPNMTQYHARRDVIVYQIDPISKTLRTVFIDNQNNLQHLSWSFQDSDKEGSKPTVSILFTHQDNTRIEFRPMTSHLSVRALWVSVQNMGSDLLDATYQAWFANDKTLDTKSLLEYGGWVCPFPCEQLALKRDVPTVAELELQFNPNSSCLLSSYAVRHKLELPVASR